MTDQPQTSTQAQSAQGEKPKPTRISIILPTNAYFMSGIRDFTLSMIKNMTKFSEQWAYRFQSVVDELCNNAIEHGSAPGQDIQVTFINVPEESIEIIIDDTGTAKDALKADKVKELVTQRSQPNFPFTAIRGRGLAKIVAAWTDELEFIDLPTGGLRVRVKKYLNKQPELKQPIPGLSADPTHVLLTI